MTNRSRAEPGSAPGSTCMCWYERRLAAYPSSRWSRPRQRQGAFPLLQPFRVCQGFLVRDVDLGHSCGVSAVIRVVDASQLAIASVERRR